MNKSDLVNFVASECDLTKRDAKGVVEAVVTGVVDGLDADGRVTLVGFGTFSLVEKAARTARNPKTGESIDIPAKVVPKFKPSAALKEQFENYEFDEAEDEVEDEAEDEAEDEVE